MKIGIAGVGGIGSNVAMNLVRAGIKNLKIIDFDKLEESNLNRQFYFKNQIGQNKVEALKENLLRINPDLNIKILNLKLEKNNMYEILKENDVIVEGFDKKEYKKDILEVFSETDKILVSASGIADNDIKSIEIKKLGNSYLVGDFKKDIKCYENYFPKINIIASMMSDIILKLYKVEDKWGSKII